MSQTGRALPSRSLYFPQGRLGDGRNVTAYGLAMLQFLFVLSMVVGLIAAPPASGRMLLVPLGGAGRDDLARIAVGTGARLVGPGPLGGSLVVDGQRAALIAAVMPGRALVLSAYIGGCGEEVNS